MLSKRQIQKTLNYLGFGNLKVDGIIGFKSKLAIKSFQKSFELTRDRNMGRKDQ